MDYATLAVKGGAVLRDSEYVGWILVNQYVL